MKQAEVLSGREPASWKLAWPRRGQGCPGRTWTCRMWLPEKV